MARLIGKLTSSGSVSGKVSAGQGAAGPGDNVQTFNTYLDFPKIGKVNVIYIDVADNASYRWNDADLNYYCIGRDYTEIDLINGGNANG